MDWFSFGCLFSYFCVPLNLFEPDNFSAFYAKLDIRSVERGICPIATPTITELFLKWSDEIKIIS